MRYLQEIVDQAYYTFVLSGGPGTVLSWILIVLTLVFTIYTLYILEHGGQVFSSFLGVRTPLGLRRMWMFNKEPYRAVLSLTGAIAGSFLTAVILILLVGVVLWGVMWLVKILFWALIIIGYIAAVLGFFGIASRDSGGAAFGVVALVIGGILIAAEDWFKATGNTLVAWGEDALNSLNVFGWVADMFMGTWQLLLVVVLAPIVIFLAVALAVLLVVGLVSAFEWCVMRYYNVHHLCPRCGHSNYDYIVEGRPYPVALHPGPYGVFHHTLRKDDDHEVRVPTMLLNGKGNLPRRCRDCGYSVTLKGKETFGTDVHIGFVGGPGTGKSWLMYGLLYRLLSRMGGRARQVDKTRDTDIDRKHEAMTRGGSFQTDAEQYTHAVQVMIRRPEALIMKMVGQGDVPWHTHWWDVAGENYDSASQATVMDFYSHVETIVLVIDPALTVCGAQPSAALSKWLKSNGHNPLYNLDETMSHLSSIIERTGHNLSEINAVVVLAKADAGYLGVDYATANADTLRNFVLKDMDLGNFVSAMEMQFSGVTYAAVSVTDNDASDDDKLLDILLSHFNIE